jgi:hypothetical protein
MPAAKGTLRALLMSAPAIVKWPVLTGSIVSLGRLQTDSLSQVGPGGVIPASHIPFRIAVGRAAGLGRGDLRLTTLRATLAPQHGRSDRLEANLLTKVLVRG